MTDLVSRPHFQISFTPKQAFAPKISRYILTPQAKHLVLHETPKNFMGLQKTSWDSKKQK